VKEETMSKPKVPHAESPALVVLMGHLPTSLWITVRKRRYPVASLEDASQKFSQVRDASGKGASETPTPLIVDDAGKVVGYIAYNGRVFPGRPQDWKSGVKPLYEPTSRGFHAGEDGDRSFVERATIALPVRKAVA
jgi:hypothetical protein